MTGFLADVFFLELDAIGPAFLPEVFPAAGFFASARYVRPPSSIGQPLHSWRLFIASSAHSAGVTGLLDTVSATSAMSK